MKKTATIQIKPLWGTHNGVDVSVNYRGACLHVTQGHKADKPWLIDNVKQWASNQGFNSFKIEEV